MVASSIWETSTRLVAPERGAMDSTDPNHCTRVIRPTATSMGAAASVARIGFTPPVHQALDRTAHARASSSDSKTCVIQLPPYASWPWPYMLDIPRTNGVDVMIAILISGFVSEAVRSEAATARTVVAETASWSISEKSTILYVVVGNRGPAWNSLLELMSSSSVTTPEKRKTTPSCSQMILYGICRPLSGSRMLVPGQSADRRRSARPSRSLATVESRSIREEPPPRLANQVKSGGGRVWSLEGGEAPPLRHLESVKRSGRARISIASRGGHPI